MIVMSIYTMWMLTTRFLSDSPLTVRIPTIARLSSKSLTVQ